MLFIKINIQNNTSNEIDETEIIQRSNIVDSNQFTNKPLNYRNKRCNRRF